MRKVIFLIAAMLILVTGLSFAEEIKLTTIIPGPAATLRGKHAAIGNTYNTSIDSGTNNVFTDNPDDVDMVVEGRVGIGTTAPTATLHIAKNPQDTANGIRFPDDTLQTSAATVLHYMKCSSLVPDNYEGFPATPGDWYTVPIFALDYSDIDGSSLDGINDTIKLPAGTYQCSAVVAIVGSSIVQTRLRNLSDNVTTIVGLKMNGNSGAAFPLSGAFTITGTKTFELQVRVSDTGHYGVSSGRAFGEVEVVAMIEFWKLK